MPSIIQLSLFKTFTAASYPPYAVGLIQRLPIFGTKVERIAKLAQPRLASGQFRLGGEL